MSPVNRPSASVMLGGPALALFLGVAQAGAQTQGAQAPRDVDAAGRQMLTQMVQPPTTFQVTPEGRELARRLVASLDGPAKLHAFGEMGVLMAKKQIAEQLKNAPAVQRAVVEKA